MVLTPLDEVLILRSLDGHARIARGVSGRSTGMGHVEPHAASRTRVAPAFVRMMGRIRALGARGAYGVLGRVQQHVTSLGHAPTHGTSHALSPVVMTVFVMPRRILVAADVVLAFCYL